MALTHPSVLDRMHLQTCGTDMTRAARPGSSGICILDDLEVELSQKMKIVIKYLWLQWAIMDAASTGKT